MYLKVKLKKMIFIHDILLIFSLKIHWENNYRVHMFSKYQLNIRKHKNHKLHESHLILILYLTCDLLFSSAGKTSLTVRSDNIPPTIRKHLRDGSTVFNVSMTTLK